MGLTCRLMGEAKEHHVPWGRVVNCFFVQEAGGSGTRNFQH